MMVIDNKFEMGAIVYLKTDPDQAARMVTAITMRHHGISYELSLGANSSWHWELEISAEKDVVLSTT